MSAITLSQLLAARDARYEKQQQLRKSYPGMTVAVLTVVLPGSEKRNSDSLCIAQAACREVDSLLGDKIVFAEKCDLETGFEAYWVVSQDALDLKRNLVTIEDTHPLGRLFDLDVIGNDGVPIARQTIGQTARRCLLCENEARFCMRNKTHSYDDILKKIRQMIDCYEQRHLC